MVRKTRGFTLKEVLIVVAILALLAALLFPVFARSKERAKLQTCESRLRQFALALNLYRGDNDERGYVWANDGRGMRAPYVFFDGMRGYLGDGAVLTCREPNPDPVTAWELVHYQTLNVYPSGRADRGALHVPPRPEPGRVIAYCSNHGTGSGPVRVGTYPFVREDTSAGLARSETVRVVYYDAKGWHDRNVNGRLPYLHFPGEPWPPRPESP